MSITKVLFRVDAGPHIGLGHLQRSLSLAAALQKMDVGSRFLLNQDSGIRERVSQHGFAFDTLPEVQPWSQDDARATQVAASSEECATVIVDSHRAGDEYLANLRDAGLYVAVRDDLAGFPFPCQMVFNGNAGAEHLRYVSSAGDTVFLLGTDYMVLGLEYRGWRPRAVDRQVENVLVTLGGTDQYNLMPQILKSLDLMPGGFKLTAIVGPFFENVDEVEKAASRMTKQVELVRSPHNVHDWIMKADLAVSAAGMTLYELARAGCPTIAFSVAQNQESQLEAIAMAGFLRVAGNAAENDVISRVGDAVRSLVEDSDSRSVMASAGRRLVDGKGAQRVAEAILEDLNSLTDGHRRTEIRPPVLRGEKLFLRPLESSDVNEEYLSWLNDHEVAKWLEGVKTASTTDTIRQYLQRFQNSATDIIFAIIDLETGLHIGNVTLNHIDSTQGTADTGLMIGRREFWGKGYATEAWSLITDYAFETLCLRQITAGAAVANKASVASLERLGFKIVGTRRVQFWADGDYQDAVRLSLSRHDFQKFSPVEAQV